MAVSEVSFRGRLVRYRVAPAHVGDYKDLKPRGADLVRNIDQRNNVKPLPEYANLGLRFGIIGILVNGRQRLERELNAALRGMCRRCWRVNI